MTTQIVTAAVMVSGELVNLEVTATDGTAANLVTSGTVGAGGGTQGQVSTPQTQGGVTVQLNWQAQIVLIA
jgi:hypothetical protein